MKAEIKHKFKEALKDCVRDAGVWNAITAMIVSEFEECYAWIRFDKPENPHIGLCNSNCDLLMTIKLDEVDIDVELNEQQEEQIAAIQGFIVRLEMAIDKLKKGEH